MFSSLFFFNDTATTEIYTLSLHDALPISHPRAEHHGNPRNRPELRSLVIPAQTDLAVTAKGQVDREGKKAERSEEHTSELQSRQYLVCRLLLEKKKKTRGHTYVKTM